MRVSACVSSRMRLSSEDASWARRSAMTSRRVSARASASSRASFAFDRCTKYRYARKPPIVARPERTATSDAIALAVASNTLTASFPVRGTRRSRQSATPRRSRGHAADPYCPKNSTCGVGPARAEIRRAPGAKPFPIGSRGRPRQPLSQLRVREHLARGRLTGDLPATGLESEPPPD
jgi:hypothetical protein